MRLRRLSLVLLPVIFLSACLSSGYRGASANLSLTINQVDSSRFPTTIGYVTALNNHGYPVLGLAAGNFQVTEDGVPVSGLRVSSAVNLQEPLAAVLTIDVSGSMTEADLAQEKAAAIAFLAALRPQDEVAVVAFSSEVRRLTGFTADRGAVSEAINGLQPSGNTVLYDALFDSVDLTARAPAIRRVVVLMTDGVNTASKAALDDGVNLAGREGVAVYTIGLGSDLDRNVLTRVAQRTGGASFLAPSAEDLRQAYDRIASELRSQYLVSYTSPRPRGARDYLLSVRVAAEGDQARAEATYRPAPPPPVISSLSLKDGETISQPVTIQAQIASQVPVASVRLRVNGRSQAESVSAPYGLPLDPGGFPAGRHEVTIIVVDEAGSEATARLHAVIPPEAANPGSAGILPAAAPALPSVSIPDISLPQLPLPELSGFLSPVGGWVAQAAAVVGDAGVTVRNWWSAAETAVGDTVQAWWSAVETAGRAHAHRFPPAGLAFAAAVAGLLQARKLLSSLRAGLRYVHCYTCGGDYRAYLLECPACLERERQRELEERGLEELLVQNNLVDREGLAAAVTAAREAGRPLEEVILEQGLLSPSDLERARYYLTHSAEIQSRLKDMLAHETPPRRSIIPGRILAVRGIALALAAASWALSLPAVLA